MGLRDHFHPPLSERRHWHAFHNAWATYIAADLNHRLPEGWFAEPNVQYGIEIDVAAFEEEPSEEEPSGESPYGSDKKPLPKSSDVKWTSPPPAQSFPFQPAAESVEIAVFNSEGGPLLAGVIELVSPANKDRQANREAFVSKCEAYLQQGLGLVVVDAVTGRNANLHNELLGRTVAATESPMSACLYAAAYRVVERNGRSSLDIWRQALEIGHRLPVMPLWLHGEFCLPIELDATYEFTCREQRII